MHRWAERLNNPLVKLLRLPLAKILELQKNNFQKAIHLLRYNIQYDKRSHIFSQEQQLFSMDEVADLMNKKVKFDLMKSWIQS